jgi:uncharacterized protein with GYD domain
MGVYLTLVLAHNLHRRDSTWSAHQVMKVIFVTLGKFRTKPSKAIIAENQKLMKEEAKEGVKTLNIFWTLGKYDTVVISEAPDEKTHMRAMLRRDWLSSQTLVAVPAEEARKFVEA